MDTKKLVLFQILMFLSMLVTSYLYFNKGLQALSYTWGYASIVLPVIILHSVIFLIGLLVLLAYVVPRALHKKNYLRISMILLIIIFLVTLIGRIVEIFTVGVFCWQCMVAVLLYLGMIILNFMMLKDLYELIQELFSYRR